MIKLTDTVKISITVTAFSTLLLMITCILYKLSKLREVMEQEPSDAQDGLVTIGLPWRRNSNESISRTSECSVCKHERRNHDSDEACRRDLHHRALRNTAEQDDRVFTGRLIMDIDYKASTRTLLVRNVIGEDLLPWEYSSSDKTYVLFYLKIGEVHDERKGEEVLGLNKACYKQNFEFKLNETDLDRAELSVSVWMSREVKDSLVGECSVLLGTENMQSTPSGMSVAISRNIMKNVTRKLESEVLLSLSYLPTAERLSVVVMKAKNIEITAEETITRNQTTVPNPFVKVCLIYGGRKIKKKKTSVKRQEKNPVYNESMIFDVPGNFLHKIGFLITVEHRNFETEQSTVLGRIVMGSPVHNHSLRHWNQMLAFPRRPVAAWHKVFYLG